VDPELAWVARWRETGEEPTEREVFMGDSRSKYYWVNGSFCPRKRDPVEERGRGLSQRSSGNKS